jgi:hypothetical protein
MYQELAESRNVTTALRAVLQNECEQFPISQVNLCAHAAFIFLISTAGNVENHSWNTLDRIPSLF